MAAAMENLQLWHCLQRRGRLLHAFFISSASLCSIVCEIALQTLCCRLVGAVSFGSLGPSSSFFIGLRLRSGLFWEIRISTCKSGGVLAQSQAYRCHTTENRTRCVAAWLALFLLRRFGRSQRARLARRMLKVRRIDATPLRTGRAQLTVFGGFLGDMRIPTCKSAAYPA